MHSQLVPEQQKANDPDRKLHRRLKTAMPNGPENFDDDPIIFGMMHNFVRNIQTTGNMLGRYQQRHRNVREQSATV
jgi:hypothetical protein